MSQEKSNWECVDTNFDCPNCGLPHDRTDYENELNEKGRAVIECINCGESLCVDTSGGNVTAWVMNQ